MEMVIMRKLKQKLQFWKNQYNTCQLKKVFYN